MRSVSSGLCDSSGAVLLPEKLEAAVDAMDLFEILGEEMAQKFSDQG